MQICQDISFRTITRLKLTEKLQDRWQEVLRVASTWMAISTLLDGKPSQNKEHLHLDEFRLGLASIISKRFLSRRISKLSVSISSM